MAIQRQSSYRRAQLLNNKGLYRIIDANRNRLKEGLRVCEEICRFVLHSASLTRALKSIRHKTEEILAKSYPSLELLASRNSSQDVGKNIGLGELQRKNTADIFFANMQRAKESMKTERGTSTFMPAFTATAARTALMRLHTTGATRWSR